MFAVIFIPDFGLQAVLRHEPELAFRPVVLVDPDQPKSPVIQMTEAAREFGVTEGQTPSQAMARCSKLIIKTRSRQQEQAATETLLQIAYGFSPNIESTAPGVCTLELKGLGIEFQQDSAGKWAAKILDYIAGFHLKAQIGFAITPELARLAARAARPVLLLRDGMNDSAARSKADAIQPLLPFLDADPTIESFPIAALEPRGDMLEILTRWGIRNVGALLALGKDRVVERLGPEAAELFDRVSPQAVRPLRCVAPPENFSERMEFEKEIETIEPLLFVLRRFVEQLSLRIQSFYLVVAEFQLRLALASGKSYERTFKIPAPTGNIETLFQILRTHLETVRTDSSIASLELTAAACKPQAHQFRLFESTLRDPNQFARTVARLMALCGADRVGTPRVLATHRPDAFRIEPPQLDGTKPGGSRGSDSNSRAGGKDDAKLNIRLKLGGPQLRRFRPAVAAHIEFRDRRPALLRSAAFTGPISNARGPYLSSGDWWEPTRWAREEWDVETRDGSLLRIFRSSDGDFVEGVYD